MSGNKVIKSVSFNLTVSDDAEMLKHVKRRNFSGYVKKLILQDLRKDIIDVPEETVNIAITPKKETSQEKLERLKERKSGASNPAPPRINLPKN
jgi:hypothetical protein